MHKATFVLIGVCSTSLMFGCASNPDKIDAAYVSPVKYQGYDCDQIALEMDYVGDRTNRLYHRLRKERTADNWQAGIGLLVFWPTLFFLEGGDGPEAAEYAQLKGEFNALQDASVQKRCGIRARSPEQIMRSTDERDRRDAEDVEPSSNRKPESASSSDFLDVQYSSQATELAKQLDCSDVVTFKGSNSGSELWAFACSDGRQIEAMCQSGSCFVTEHD